MRRFQFRLDGVLQLRRFELDRERSQLGALEAERSERQKRVDDAAERLSQGRALLEAEMSTGIEAPLLSLHADGVSAGAFELVRAEFALSEMEPLLEAARERVRYARSRVKSLEKLREKRVAIHASESARLEQAELDEMALNRIVHGAISTGRGDPTIASPDGLSVEVNR